jgi:hypothetical protein
MKFGVISGVEDLRNILREQREIIKEHSKVVAALGKGNRFLRKSTVSLQVFSLTCAMVL